MQQLLQARIAGEDQERRLFDSRRNGGGKGKKEEKERVKERCERCHMRRRNDDEGLVG